MDAQLMLYENMRQISIHMVDAARANDWDRLCELETQVARLRDQLMAQPKAVPPVRDETARTRKLALIKQLLDDDREIRSHAEPWMENVRVLLAGNARQKAVQKAYGVGL
ncbi:flagellar protein FliT [Uliginosibacterium gangwonense]|uniref:flagellar protein FliT n=1 Tax=Uliginosibacterium gangwonense TaxID=392736 RepID=UPI000361C663|nr:flagellar protein FliT [Uliginosibacterium gangwonense]